MGLPNADQEAVVSDVDDGIDPYGSDYGLLRFRAVVGGVAMEVITLPPKNRENEIARLIQKALTFCVGKPVNVKFTIARPERTPDQLRYLWGVAIKLLSDHTGFEPDDVHEYLCGMHWGWKPKNLPGKRTVDIPIRTTTTDEDGERDVIDGEAFWKYVEFLQRVGAKQGVYIPDPDPHYKIARAR